jgi:hypothetical protein
LLHPKEVTHSFNNTRHLTMIISIWIQLKQHMITFPLTISRVIIMPCLPCMNSPWEVITTIQHQLKERNLLMIFLTISRKKKSNSVRSYFN